TTVRRPSSASATTWGGRVTGAQQARGGSHPGTGPAPVVPGSAAAPCLFRGHSETGAEGAGKLCLVGETAGIGDLADTAPVGRVGQILHRRLQAGVADPLAERRV